MIGLRPGVRQIRRYDVRLNHNGKRHTMKVRGLREIEAPEFNGEPIIDLIDEGIGLRLTVNLVTELLKEGKVKTKDGTYKNGVLEINLLKSKEYA